MQPEGSETGAVSITVLSVKPMRSGKLFALASVELDIDGVRIEIHGIRALRVDPVGTRIELPSIFPFTSGITSDVALAAPVVVGIIDNAAARARRRSLCGKSRICWSLV